MQQAQEMIGIMPQMMRGQRVIELAQARNYDWLPQARLGNRDDRRAKFRYDLARKFRAGG